MLKSLCIICALVFMVGCAGMSIELTDTQDVLVKMAARAFGYQLAMKDPSVVAPAKVVCTTLTTGDLTQAILDEIQSYLNNKFKNDPLMTASFADLVSLVKVNSNSMEYDNELVKKAAEGCLEGLVLYESVNTAKH